MQLRDVRDDDLPIFFAHQHDPEASRMAAFTAREWDAFMTHWRGTVLGNERAGKQTIVVDGEVAGNVVSWDQEAERLVGYWIGRDYWGRGIATAALLAYLAYDTTRPLHAHVAAHNLGSIRVLEKCGFHRVGDCSTGADGVAEHLFVLDA
jgi:RimJ/RimL family protein N-acetyltransferase